MIPDSRVTVRTAPAAAPTSRTKRLESGPVRRTVTICAALLLLGAAGCASVPAPPAAAPSGSQAAQAPADPGNLGAARESAARWVDETLARLTLRQKVGQLAAPWLAGDFLATDGEAYDRFREWVVEQGIGGVVISIGPPLEIAAKLNLLQQLAEVPLLVTADMEHGPGQRLNGGIVLPYGMKNGGGTAFPPVMALGAADDEGLAYELGRITALEARAVGVGMVLAPVVDVNNNPANPVINTRSYGSDPARVSRLAAAQIRGLQDHGVYAVAKHFPGHGDTGVDSHIDLPLIAVDRARADSVELPPFRAAIAAGVAGVMSAHITFPALTGDTTPATLSPRILTGLLREELGFSGVVVSDALDMGAIVRRYGPGEAMVRAIEAGADLLLMPPDLPAALDAVVAAVESGRLTEARIDRSVRKLLELKAGLGLPERRTVPLDLVAERVAGRAHLAIAEEVARRAITLVRDRDALLPLGVAAGARSSADASARPNGGPRQRALSITYTGDPDPLAGRAFNQMLAPNFASLRSVQIDPATPAARLDSLLAEAAGADVVFVSTYVRVITGKGSIAMPEAVAALITKLDRARPTVVTSFGNPYLLEQFPDVGTYVLAWGPEEVAQRAAASAIIGKSPITGTLPIAIPPDYPVGSGIRRGTVSTTSSAATAADAAQTAGTPALLGTPAPSDNPRLVDPAEVGMDPASLARVDELIQAAVRAGAIPGAALAIGRHGKLVRLRGYGRLDPDPGSAAVTDSSIYDLASLTKVVGTTSAIMLLVEEGRLDLDAPVVRYIPEWRGSATKERVTVRQLLMHTAGLPAFSPLWRELRGQRDYLRRIAALDLEYRPGTREVYSDFGMILAGIIAERIAGQPLDLFLEERIFLPLGLRETGFNPRTWEPGPAGGLLARKAAPLPVDAPADDTVPLPARDDPAGDPAILARIAPTEVDTSYRMTHVHGVVHDENAYALGGVAGHAGLFSSARDLAAFAQLLLDGGRGFLLRETLRDFTTRAHGNTSRALGWDTPAGRSSAGDYFTARSFGHTGFTGTSIWIDPERDIFVVLLTNRVNPTRANQGHIPLRRAVHDAAQQAITDMRVTRR
jgi:beta-glucosidase-like glycosyl hydrolase/CubicO group peptidase (beta-lactamase class C family)